MAAAALLAPTLALQGAGTALSAGSTIAGGVMSMMSGNATQAADQFQSAQIRENEGSAIGAGQRQMLDKQLQTKMAMSSLEARAAGGGVNAGVGSPLAAEKSIASRGTYQSLMDLYNGENKAVGMENEAKGLDVSGDIAARAGRMQMFGSLLNAGGTIAGGGASMLRTYGAFNYPSLYSRPGVGYG